MLVTSPVFKESKVYCDAGGKTWGQINTLVWLGNTKPYVVYLIEPV